MYIVEEKQMSQLSPKNENTGGLNARVRRIQELSGASASRTND